MRELICTVSGQIAEAKSNTKTECSNCEGYGIVCRCCNLSSDWCDCPGMGRDNDHWRDCNSCAGTGFAKSNTIRITNDRNNPPNLGEGQQLSHQGDRRRDILESRTGLPGAFTHATREFGSVPHQVGSDPRRQASSSNGRDSGLTFPAKVHPFETFARTGSYDARAARNLHIKANESRYEETYADSCERDSRIVFGTKVHFAIIGIALLLVAAVYFLPSFGLYLIHAAEGK